MRILVLSPFPPRRDATHGGARVVAELLVRLSERHELALVCLRAADEPSVDEALVARLAEVREVAHPVRSSSVWAQRARRASALLRGRPLWDVESASREFSAQVADLTRSWKHDVCQLYWDVMIQYATDVPTVLVAPEVASLRTVEELRGLSGRIDAAVWRRVERRALANLDATVVFTEEDRAGLLALDPAARVEVIPFAVEPPPAALDPVGEGDSILFVGNFRHTPNVDAALRLGQNIFPLVKSQLPSATLRLVGAQPPPEIRALASSDVEVAADVPDTAAELGRAAVVALPLRLGGGMRVKTLEALGAGKAVVASSLALRGTHVVDRRDVVICESDEEFATEIVALLRGPSRRSELAHAARQWAETHSRWDPLVRQHEQLLQSLI